MMNEQEPIREGSGRGWNAREERLRSLLQAAYPGSEPDEALEQHVAELVARHTSRVDQGCGSSSAAAASRQPGAGRMGAIARHGRRLGWGFAVLAVLTLLWAGSQFGSDPVAAAIRATEAARAWHSVWTADNGSVREGWFVLGVGSYERLMNRAGATEQITVDDGKRRYVYKLVKREVEVWPSEMTDPTSRRQEGQHFTGSGLLKELQQHYPPRAIRIRDVVLHGRRLREISVPGDLPRVYLDPKSDRVVFVDVEGGGAWRMGLRQCAIDYPDPARIDPAWFRFQIPAGVHVVRYNPALQPINSSEPGVVCSWRLLQLKKSFIAYLYDHHGEWPQALRPDLDRYVQDEGEFYCPLDRDMKHKPTSYIYHRPAAPVDPAALEASWNAQNNSSPATSMALGMLVECRLHDGETKALYRDGRVMGWPIGKGPAARP